MAPNSCNSKFCVSLLCEGKSGDGNVCKWIGKSCVSLGIAEGTHCSFSGGIRKAGHILSGNLCGSSDMQLEVKVLGLLSFSVTVVWCVTQVKSPNSFVFWFILSVKWGIVVIY